VIAQVGVTRRLGFRHRTTGLSRLCRHRQDGNRKKDGQTDHKMAHPRSPRLSCRRFRHHSGTLQQSLSDNQ
jgi:hypothetical protein